MLTNADGGVAMISVAPTSTSFSLGSFYATPVYVPTLTLDLVGTTVAGKKLRASFLIVNPERTQVRARAQYAAAKWLEGTHQAVGCSSRGPAKRDG